MTHGGAIFSLAIGMLRSAGADAARAEHQDAEGNPDRLYADRAQLDRAIEAAAIWEGRLSAGRTISRRRGNWPAPATGLGGHVPANERRKQYERGVAAGKRAVDIDAARPEGQFWMAANMGTLAESFGLRAGLRYRGPVKRELETVLRINPCTGRGWPTARWDAGTCASPGCSGAARRNQSSICSGR